MGRWAEAPAPCFPIIWFPSPGQRLVGGRGNQNIWNKSGKRWDGVCPLMLFLPEGRVQGSAARGWAQELAVPRGELPSRSHYQGNEFAGLSCTLSGTTGCHLQRDPERLPWGLLGREVRTVLRGRGVGVGRGLDWSPHPGASRLWRQHGREGGMRAMGRSPRPVWEHPWVQGGQWPVEGSSGPAMAGGELEPPPGARSSSP